MPTLRDYLLTLQGVQESTGQFAKSAADYRKSVDEQALKQRLPQLLESGADLSQLAAGVAPFDPSSALAIRLKQLEGQKSAKTIYSDAAVDALPGLKPETKAAAKGLQGQERMEFIGDAMKGAGVERGDLLAGVALDSEKRRGEKEIQNQRGAFQKIFNDFEKNVESERRSLSKVEKAFAQDSVTGDSIVFNFIARNVAGEKGPLSNDDINRIVARQIGGDFTSALNFVSNNDASKLTKEQRNSYRNLINVAKDNFEDYQSQTAARIINDSSGDYPLLYTSGGTPDETIRKRAERFGINVGGGSVSTPKKTKEVDGASAVGRLINLANQLPDGPEKQAALKNLSSKKDITEAQAKAYETQIKAKLGR